MSLLDSKPLQAPAAPPSFRLMGMPISAVTEAQAIDHIIASVQAQCGGWVITPNLDQLRQYCHQPEVRDYYERASLVLADGMPLVWASRLQRTPLKERVAGSSMIHTLSAAAARCGASIYLLGGNPAGAAEQAAARLAEQNPGLKLAGTYCPPFGFEKDPAQMSQIEMRLRESRADIVYVGLGFPKQEWLIDRVRHCLPRAWFLGIGVSFSFVAGAVQRAPRWMQNHGLEWVHRMAQEPGRLFKRYVLHDIPFAAELFLGALKARRMGRKKR